MGGSNKSSGQSEEQKKTERLNQQSLLLQQKQAAAQDKRLAKEQFNADVSEWEADELLKAKRAGGAARRAGGSLFDESNASSQPEEPDYGEFDSIMAGIDAEIAATKKAQTEADIAAKKKQDKINSATSGGKFGAGHDSNTSTVGKGGK